MLTKKHFEKIAEIIRKNVITVKKPEETYIKAHRFIDDLSFYFSEINPNFDKDKFVDYVKYNFPKTNLEYRFDVNSWERYPYKN
jgi:hypothetical protein